MNVIFPPFFSCAWTHSLQTFQRSKLMRLITIKGQLKIAFQQLGVISFATYFHPRLDFPNYVAIVIRNSNEKHVKKWMTFCFSSNNTVNFRTAEMPHFSSNPLPTILVASYITVYTRHVDQLVVSYCINYYYSILTSLSLSAVYGGCFSVRGLGQLLPPPREGGIISCAQRLGNPRQHRTGFEPITRRPRHEWSANPFRSSVDMSWRQHLDIFFFQVGCRLVDRLLICRWISIIARCWDQILKLLIRKEVWGLKATIQLMAIRIIDIQLLFVNIQNDL